MVFRPNDVRTATTLFGLTAAVALQSAGIAATRSSRTAPPSSARPHVSAFMARGAASGNVPVLFVSDVRSNAVYLYNANTLGAPIGMITDGVSGGPSAMAVDGSGNLYVLVSPGLVQVYPPGALHPARTIQFSQQRLVSVAAATDGTVATMTGEAFQTDGSLYIFDKGSLSPTRTVDIPIDGNLLATGTLAIDASDNIFVATTGYPNGDGDVFDVAPGSIKLNRTNLHSSAVSIGFDASENFFTGLQIGVDVFAPGSSRPSRRIRHGISVEELFTVLPDGTLFVPNFNTHRGTKSGNVVKYLPGQSRPAAVVNMPNPMNPMGTAYRPALR